MKKTIHLALLLSVSSAFSQVGVGTLSPATSSILHLNSPNRGLLIPNIALTATNVAAPVVAPVNSLMIYNTATAGTAPNNVTPGFYYWNNTQWASLGSATGTATPHRVVTASYTVTSADNAGVIEVNSSGNASITIPSTLPLGFNVVVYRTGTGEVSITGSGISVVGTLGTRVFQQNSAVGVMRGSTNVIVTGDSKV